MNSLFFKFSIKELVKLCSEKKISPTEIAVASINQIKSLDPIYRAWVCFDEEKLLYQAKESENRILKKEQIRYLESIPVGVKDVFNTKDFPTQMGSPIWKNFMPGNDARVVFNLKNLGAIIPGKTETAEFAVHTLGKTLNPYDPLLTPGTSSSGSTVAVATGMIPFALGTQTAGSIVRPASFCGVYGVKPSFGLIPRTGILKTTDSLDTVGYFVAHFEDIKYVFEALRVHGLNYPTSNSVLSDKIEQSKKKGQPWKIGFVKTHTWNHAPNYAQDSILGFVKHVSKNKDIEIDEIDLPGCMHEAHLIHSIIYNKTLAYYFKDEFKKSKLISPIMNELIEHGNKISLEQYQKALKDQLLLSSSMDLLFTEYDALISLSTAGHAPQRNVMENPDPALMWTMTYLPVISAPVFTSTDGYPFGLQLIGRRYRDYKLFDIASFLRDFGYIPNTICSPVTKKVKAITSQKTLSCSLS